MRSVTHKKLSRRHRGNLSLLEIAGKCASLPCLLRNAALQSWISVLP